MGEARKVASVAIEQGGEQKRGYSAQKEKKEQYILLR